MSERVVAAAEEGQVVELRRSGRRPRAVANGVRAAAILVALVVLAVFPLVFSNPAVTTIAFFTLVFMTSTTAWNGFAGYSGYIPLGHAVFFGTGAYTLAIVAQDLHMPGGYGVFWLVPLAGAAALVVAIPFGLIALRTRRHTFVVITIAIFFIFQLLSFNLGITQGSSGIQTPTPPWFGGAFNIPFYYVGAVILVLSIAVSWFIRRSRFGLQTLAIRDDEDRARGLGVQVGRVKLVGYVISAIPVGMVGALYAYFIGQIFPQSAFDPLFDITIALMAFLGGLGTVSGPLLGALVLEPLQQYFTVSDPSYYLIAYGALFLIVILALPRGVVPTVGAWIGNRRARRAAPSPAAAGEASGGAPGGTRYAATVRSGE